MLKYLPPFSLADSGCVASKDYMENAYNMALQARSCDQFDDLLGLWSCVSTWSSASVELPSIGGDCACCVCGFIRRQVVVGEAIAIVGAVLLWPVVFAGAKKTIFGRRLIIATGIILVVVGSSVSYSVRGQSDEERVVEEDKKAAENIRKVIRIRSWHF